ncbi:MAG: YitT family protein [Lachnospiraceae bacterium]|nr:YitT family protein [Lachnospiraceae bacterium]
MSVCIFAGNTLLAFLVEAFVIPHNIVMGGTTGIGIVLSKLFPQLNVSHFVLIMNIILLFIGLFILGKKFFFSTIASSLLYPVMLFVFEQIPGIQDLTDNSLLAAIFAGCLMGIALGLVMRVGSSTGGIDVINLILHKWTHLPIALYVWVCDLVVIFAQIFVFSPNDILLGLLVLVLESVLLDRAMILGKAQIQLYIISRKYDEIRHAILHDLEAGATMMIIETGLLGESGKGVISIIPERKLYQATELVRKIDPEAFITITKINEVRGRGFTLERQKKEEAAKL